MDLTKGGVHNSHKKGSGGGRPHYINKYKHDFQRGRVGECDIFFVPRSTKNIKDHIISGENLIFVSIGQAAWIQKCVAFYNY